MIVKRPAAERGHADYGWLETSYTFSFNTYHDPAHMGFRVLRVMNEDVVMPGQGFGMHGHRDMEIITYVISGALEHRDSLGSGGILRAGEVQRMTAGTGIRHSEFNPSGDEPVHLYQIWILPDRPGHVPGYEQKPILSPGDADGLRLVASSDGRDGSLTIQQDACVYLGGLDAGQVLDLSLPRSRHGWVQVIRGALQMRDETLNTSDGASVSDEPALQIKALEPTRFLFFDLP
jgi:redox-sensitive bicupin YhaK (pirin superfamily)